MKSMTCRQMGGPCDAQITGNTPEEMMKNGQDHLFSRADEGHKKAIEMMDEMEKNPQAGKKWNDEFLAKFAQL